MTAYLLANHVLSLLAPSAFVAVMLVLLGKIFNRFLGSNRPVAQSIWAQAAIIFVTNAIVTAAGLIYFGNDGKMVTYAVMVLAAGLTYWVMIRSRAA